MRSPLDARRHGIETVYQDLALAPDLSGRREHVPRARAQASGSPGGGRARPARRCDVRAREQLDRLRIRIDSVTERAERSRAASAGDRGRACSRAGRRVILMDEPTAALGVEEQAKVAGLIGEVRRNGIPVLLVSHNIPQVHDICDRMVVLFQGRVVADLTHAADMEDVVMWITGAAIRLQEIREQEERRGS